ncbi:MAG: Zn-dependent hydrolase, partial [Chloroflexota bacterium]
MTEYRIEKDSIGEVKVPKDALYAASLLVAAVHDVAVDIPGEQVATVGLLNAAPNAPNIVPGRVELT